MQRKLNPLYLLPMTVAQLATACGGTEMNSPSISPSISVEVSIPGGRSVDLPILESFPLVAVVRDSATGQRLDDAVLTWQMTVDGADVLADIVSFRRTGAETAEIMFLTDALADVTVSAMRLDRFAVTTLHLRGAGTGLATRSGVVARDPAGRSTLIHKDPEAASPVEDFGGQHMNYNRDVAGAAWKDQKSAPFGWFASGETKGVARPMRR